MLTIVADVLAGLIGVGIIGIGACTFWAPRAAVGFGIPDAPVENRGFQSWLMVKGVRDMATGLFIFIVLANGMAHLTGWFMLAAALIPLGDASIVARRRGPRSAVYGIHGGTAVVLVAIAVMLLF